MLLLGALVVQYNQVPLQLQFLDWQSPEIAAGIVICAAILLGIIIGFGAVLPLWLMARYRIKRLQGKLNQTPQYPASAPPSTLEG